MKKSFTIFTLFIISNSICLASQGPMFPDIEDFSQQKRLNWTCHTSDDHQGSYSECLYKTYDGDEDPFNLKDDQNTPDTMDEDLTELFDPEKHELAGPFSLEEHEERERQRTALQNLINSSPDPLNGINVINFKNGSDQEKTFSGYTMPESLIPGVIPEEFEVHSSKYNPNFLDLTLEKQFDTNFIVGKNLEFINPKNSNPLNLSFEKKPDNHSVSRLEPKDEKRSPHQKKEKNRAKLYRQHTGRKYSPGFMPKLKKFSKEQSLKKQDLKPHNSRRPTLKRETHNLEKQLRELALSHKPLT
ncbi:MAG: hypothetical protein ACRYGR_03390 [Janthinobacterium lividum]